MYDYCNIKTLVLGDSVTSIGSRAFQSSNLEGDLVIPASVTYIGDYAFNGVLRSLSSSNVVKVKISSVYIPSTIEYIGDYAFADNEHLFEIRFSGNDKGFGTSWSGNATIITE